MPIPSLVSRCHLPAAPCKNSMAMNNFPPSFPPAHHLRIPLSLLLLLLLLALFSTCSFSSAARTPYADHCNSVVPESEATSLFVDSYSSFRISNGYFSGGDHLFHPKPTSDPSSLPFFYFRSKYLHKTRSPDILQVDGTLVLRGAEAPIASDSSMLYRNHSRGNFSTVSFDFSGFWSESTGKLCMVGHGVFDQSHGNLVLPSAVLKLNYPKTSNISTSLIRGTVESLSPADSPNHFDPISLLAYAQKKYDLTMIPQARSSCSSLHFEEKSLAFEPSSTCNYLQDLGSQTFKLDYKTGCSGSNCRTLATSFGFSSRFMSFNLVQCTEEGNLHLYIGFSNSSNPAYDHPMVPKKSLVGEGYWDHDKNNLCLIACHILEENSQTSSSVGDCTIGLSLWFPTVRTLRRRSDIVGRIWSTKNKNDAGYFSMVSFEKCGGQMFMIPGLKYNYTEIDSVTKSCTALGRTNSSEKTFPDLQPYDDMRLHVSLKHADGRTSWGHANLLSVGETFYGNGVSWVSNSTSSIPAVNRVDINHGIWNVSYAISYMLSSASSNEYKRIDIAAEGIYNAGSGSLCMKGCRYPSSSPTQSQTAGLDSDSLDCEILINIQFPPLKPKVEESAHGTINSTRSKTDSLYFDPIELTSRHMYIAEALETIKRMDVEIIMVLIALTFSCICLGLQTFHVRKHPDALPSMSITMLGILVLGYTVPLVLNFEALFVNQKQYSVYLRSGGWLDANEVVVRVISMVALFLSFRLLQAAWSVRSQGESKGHCVAEWTTLKLCLPLYFAGALLAWFINSRRHELGVEQQYRSHWEDLISYAGLVLDGFLLPQIVLNICQNSKDKVLTPFFYVGITVTRALPHLYDVYRTHHYLHVNSSYIYASPDRDFYSLAWDVIIPCEGFLFAAIIYLQQQFGGGCFLPRRFRRLAGYEAVPVVSL